MLQEKRTINLTVNISTLKQDSEILIKWHSIDGKAPLKISLIKLVDNNKSCCSRSDSCR